MAPFSQEQVEKIRAAIAAKSRNICPSCGAENSRQVPPGIHLFGLNGEAVWKASAEFIVPAVITVCSVCALMEFFNIHRLGLAETLGVPVPPTPIPVEGQKPPEGRANG
jgi:hypothetical protein